MLYQRNYTDEIAEIFENAVEGAIHRAVLIDENDDYKIHVKINYKRGFSWEDTGMGVVIDINNRVVTDQSGNALVNLVVKRVDDEPKLPLTVNTTYTCRRRQTKTFETQLKDIRAEMKDFVVYDDEDTENTFSPACKECKWSHDGVNMKTGHGLTLCKLKLTKVEE